MSAVRALILGGPGATAFAASATEDITLAPKRPMRLGRLFVVANVGTLHDHYIKQIEIDGTGDKLINRGGQVPMSMFDGDAIGSPRFGHLVKNNWNVTITATNDDGTNASELSAGFTELDDSDVSKLPFREGRSIIAVGQTTAVAAIADDASLEIEFAVNEEARIGQLFAAELTGGSIEGLMITEINHQGKNLMQGAEFPLAMALQASFGGKIFGLDLTPDDDTFSMVIKNVSGGSLKPVLGFSTY